MAWLKRIWTRLTGWTGERAQDDGSTSPEGNPTNAAADTSESTTVNQEAPAAASPSVDVTETPVIGALSSDFSSRESVEGSGVFGVGWVTDAGKVRGHNEDGLFVFISEQEGADVLPPFGLFVLADGMGGHQAGEVASSLASRTVAAHLLSGVYISLLRDEERVSTQPSLTEVITSAVDAANRAVNHRLPGSGTTLTCGMVLGARLFIGHVGDSRAYLRSKDGEIRHLTTDHSMVSKLVEIGQLTPEEAAIHPQRNMLYRAVGQGTALEVDVMSFSLQKQDQILLCSDGLWGLLSDEEIWQIIDASGNPTEACQRLADAANGAGGNDNITAILVEIQRGLV